MSDNQASASQRYETLHHWLALVLGGLGFDLVNIAGDASVRRYARVLLTSGESLVAMDAPPDKLSVLPFLDVARRLSAAGVCVPAIVAAEPTLGFVLMTDLGGRDYLSALTTDSAERLYGTAMDSLASIQGAAGTEGMPQYTGDLLEREMGLFVDWYLRRHLGLSPTNSDRASYERVTEFLVGEALCQPRCFVHRDYHSRNLMVTNGPSPGVLDFQDAVVGPMTYDLVSLLRDCYIAWPPERVKAWAADAHAVLAGQSSEQRPSWRAFWRGFELMGVQRHLKAIGIFARLLHRDGKPGYVKDIPRTLDYIADVAVRYPELAPLRGILDGVADHSQRNIDTE